jgi:hypothetical protein
MATQIELLNTTDNTTYQVVKMTEKTVVVEIDGVEMRKYFKTDEYGIRYVVIEGLVGLRTLYFNDNRVSNLKPISDLVGLVNLDFANNSVTDISALENLTALEWVDVTGNPIEDYSPLDNLPDCEVYR